VPGYRLLADADLHLFADRSELIGREHGVGVCVIRVDMAPGEGVRLHRHTYPELFVVEEGEATYRIGEERVTVSAPVTLIVEAGIAHAFVNTGSTRLKQVDIHLNPEFVTEWLE
jgi:quercetin dioxygenase-like cupin family protein